MNEWYSPQETWCDMLVPNEDNSPFLMTARPRGREFCAGLSFLSGRGTLAVLPGDVC